MGLRDTNLVKLNGGSFDVLIVGGGINGAVSAAALAARGASVAVIDRGDFACFTSMESSNLVWGGFKYLENYEIGLVRNLCLSRNHLMRAYPANLKEIRFLATLDQHTADRLVRVSVLIGVADADHVAGGQPDAAGAARRLDRHGLDQPGIGVEFLVGLGVAGLPVSIERI